VLLTCCALFEVPAGSTNHETTRLFKCAVAVWMAALAYRVHMLCARHAAASCASRASACCALASTVVLASMRNVSVWRRCPGVVIQESAGAATWDYSRSSERVPRRLPFQLKRCTIRKSDPSVLILRGFSHYGFTASLSQVRMSGCGE
jgi:hypothetical protein